MTKQEEIEQGFCDRIAAILQAHDCGMEINRETARAVLRWLSIKGVVIEVGYSIEPLIKEEE